MDSSSLKEKTVKGLFWGGVSNGIMQLFVLIFGVILARLLDARDYGLVGMLAIFTALSTELVNSGFINALINRPSYNQKEYNAVFWFNLSIGVGIYVALFFAAPLIADFYNAPELIPLGRILFLGIPISAAGVSHSAYLAKYLMVKEKAKIDLTAQISSGIFGVILALNGFAYYGIAMQTVSFVAISAILRWHYSPFRPTLSFDFSPLRPMFRYSITLLLTNIFMHINNNFFSVLLGRLYNPTQVGYYTQGNKWMAVGQGTIVMTISGVAQPVFAQVKGDPARELNILRKMVSFGAMVSLPAMFGLAFIAEEFIVITIGEKWLEAVPFLQMLSLWGAMGFLWHLMSGTLFSHHKSLWYMYAVVATGLLQITSALLCEPLGIYIMVISYIASYFVGVMILFALVNRILPYRFLSLLRDIAPYLGAAILAIVTTYLVTLPVANIYLLLPLKVVLVAVIYSLTLHLCGSAIFKEAIDYITSKLKSTK